MIDSKAVIDAIRSALHSDPRMDIDNQHVDLTFADGDLRLSGEVGDIAQKRLATYYAAQPPEIAAVIDELRVRPAETVSDLEIVDGIARVLTGEPALAGCTIRERIRGGFHVIHWASTRIGQIDFGVRQGVAILDGKVSSLTQKRLAGALVWQCLGICDVRNNLGVEPPEDDSDAAISDAVGLVLDRDPAVHAGGIRVVARNGHVVLEGLVRAPAEVAAAEHDAWLVQGVSDVASRLVVAA